LSLKIEIPDGPKIGGLGLSDSSEKIGFNMLVGAEINIVTFSDPNH